MTIIERTQYTDLKLRGLAFKKGKQYFYKIPTTLKNNFNNYNDLIFKYSRIMKVVYISDTELNKWKDVAVFLFSCNEQMSVERHSLEPQN